MRAIRKRTNAQMAFEASLRGLTFDPDKLLERLDSDLSPEQLAAVERAHEEAQHRLRARYGK